MNAGRHHYMRGKLQRTSDPASRGGVTAKSNWSDGQYTGPRSRAFVISASASLPLNPQNMTRHDLILKSLKTSRQTTRVYQSIHLQENSNVILTSINHNVKGGHSCPNITVNLNQSFLSTLTPTQVIERDASTCFLYNKKRGGRHHFLSTFFQNNSDQSWGGGSPVSTK